MQRAHRLKEAAWQTGAVERVDRGQRVRTIGPMALAVFGFGVSFGVLARAAGMGVLAPIVMSATTFAGSAQFAALSVAGDGGTVAAAVAAALLLNARYVPIGISIAPSLSGGVPRRFVLGQLTVDESWALSSRADGTFDLRTLALAGVALYVGWIAGTTIGVFAGNLVGDPARFGLDAAFPALFLALLVPQLRTPLDRRVALLGGAVALVLIPLAPAGVPIIAASAACLLGWRKR
jgi:4-azaleucine resistance transporter AzlC